MPAKAGTQVTSRQEFGIVQKLNDPKRISDLGSRLRGKDVVGWQRIKN
jgi:hypothetical protein